MLEMLGPILGGIGQLAGGIGGIVGGGRGGDGGALAREQFDKQMQLARDQLAFQREAATSGIKWKVDDARNAGLHPLFALGGQTFNPSPISVSPTASSSSDGYSPDLGASFSRMGQGLERAISATQSKQERALTAMELEERQLRLEGQRLSNQETAARTASILARTGDRSAQVGPGFPSPVINNVHGVHEMKPAEPITTNPDNPGVEAGPAAPANRGFRMGRSDVVTTLPSKDLQIDEASSPGWFSWIMNNRIYPWLSKSYSKDAEPPKSMLPPGAIGWRIGLTGWHPVYPDLTDKQIRGSIHYAPRRPSAKTYGEYGIR